MPLFTFNLYRADGVPLTLLSQELALDREALEFAGSLLDQHLSCDHVEIWEGDQPVVSRHRLPPLIRIVAGFAHGQGERRALIHDDQAETSLTSRPVQP